MKKQKKLDYFEKFIKQLEEMLKHNIKIQGESSRAEGYREAIADCISKLNEIKNNK